MYSRNTFVKCAEKFLGCNEADGTHKQIIDIYNSKKPLPRGYAVKYTDSWCAGFVSAVAINSGYTKIIPIECSCNEMIKLAKSMGCWKEADDHMPEAGDIVFYDWDDTGKGDCIGYPEHVGIVSEVSGGKIYVIEGNYKNAVAIRSLAVNGRYIRGFCVPRFDSVKTEKVKLPDLNSYTGTSIVEGLNSVGYDSSFSSRKELWKKLGNTEEYKGTAKQNLSLIKQLQSSKIPSLKGYKGFSIVDGLNSFGYPSGFYYRKTLWKMIGEKSEYKGTSKQNTRLLTVLKNM